MDGFANVWTVLTLRLHFWMRLWMSCLLTGDSSPGNMLGEMGNGRVDGHGIVQHSTA